MDSREIFIAGGAALFRKQELVLNKHIEKLGRGVIGVLAGLPLVGVGIGQVTPFALPGLVVSVITVALGIGAGVVLAKSVKGISPQTGILCMLPGGSSTIPVIAMETGADYRLVALSQYLRLLIVPLSLPWWGLTSASYCIFLHPIFSRHCCSRWLPGSSFRKLLSYQILWP